MTATYLPCEVASLRIRAVASPCHACVPWEKLSLATDIPSRIRAERIFLSALAGPMVHTIFVAGKPDIPPVPRIPLLRVPPGGPCGVPPEVITLLQRGLSGGGLVFPAPVCISKMHCIGNLRRSGGTGRRAGLKIPWPQGREGSTPSSGTTFSPCRSRGRTGSLPSAGRVRKVWNSNTKRRKKHIIKRKLFSLPFLPSGCFIKYHCIFNQIKILPLSRTMAFSLLYVMSGGRVW